MRILMINDSYLGIGGEKTYIKNLIASLRLGGHEVYFLAITDEPEFLNKYNRIINYKFKNKLQWFIAENIININLYLKIRKHIKSIKPDIIHFHNIYKSTKTILLASSGFAKIQTVHDFGIVCPLRSLIIEKDNYKICLGRKGLKCYKNGCLKLQSNLIDYLLLESSFLKKKSIKYFICPSTKLTAMAKEAGFKKVINLPHFYNHTSKVNYQTSNNILFVGRLTKEKGIDYLIRAFQIAFHKNNNLRLKIIGDGPEKENLKNLLNKLGIDKCVNLINGVDHSQIGQCYQDSFVVVIPSIWMENSPLVAYEAMAYAKPIIAYNIGGLPDLVQDGINGFLIDRFNYRAMAEKILQLANNQELCQKMGRTGKLFLTENFSAQKHLKILFSIYKKSIDEKNNNKPIWEKILFKIKIGKYRWGWLREDIYEDLNKKYNQAKLPDKTIDNLEKKIKFKKINKISIIITTKNRKDILEKYALVGLQNLRHSLIDYEIIIVDNGSNKTTEDYLKNIRIKNLLVIRENKIGCSAGRNAGIKKATGDIIIFIDDDCLIDDDWLNRIYNYFNTNNYLVGVGHIYDVILKKILNPDHPTEIEKNFLEGNIYFRREVFDYAKFNENIVYGAEGYDLISQINIIWPNFPYFIDKIPIAHFRAPSQYRSKNDFKLNDMGHKTEAISYRLWYVNKHIFRRNLNINSNLFNLSYWFKEIIFLPTEMFFIIDLYLLIKTKLFIYKQLLKIRKVS